MKKKDIYNKTLLDIDDFCTGDPWLISIEKKDKKIKTLLDIDDFCTGDPWFITFNIWILRLKTEICFIEWKIYNSFKRNDN